jgi:hypothetical protein
LLLLLINLAAFCRCRGSAEVAATPGIWRGIIPFSAARGAYKPGTGSTELA